MSDPTISMVLGVYNGAEQLRETIDSALAQTFRNHELILINDGSTDPRVERVLAEYEGSDRRVRIIRKNNEGLTRALIDGCAAARGAYIARMDVGDRMLPSRLERQKALLDAHPEAVLATCWTEFCGPEWEPLFTAGTDGAEDAETDEWVAPFSGDGADGDRKFGPTHHGSVMFRREAYRRVGGYHAQFYYGQDWDLWYRLAGCGSFCGISSVLYRCRIMADGLSMQNVELQRRIRACAYGAFLARSRGGDETGFMQEAARIRPSRKAEHGGHSARPAAAGWYFLGEALRRNRDMRCRRYFWRAIRSRPLDVRSWIRWGQSLWGAHP